jgi:predicted nucleic-acid-binding protein
MKVTVDTNVLIRAVVGDDPKQSKAAAKILIDAQLIAITVPSLCEFVWVLLKVYSFKPADAAMAIRTLLNAGNLVVNRAAVDAGLSLLEAGGDFADGAIAYEGRWLGGEIFVSFDKKAVALLCGQGQNARLI